MDDPADSPDADGRPAVGPVDNLEAHVPPDWWHTLFGPTYLMTDGDVLTESHTREEVDHVIERLALDSQMRILDLCCGQGRHTLELARRGYEQVQGLDRSAFLIGEARQAAAREGLRAAFQVGDCRELPFRDGSFDAVLLMGNSFGYFEAAEDDRAVLGEVRRVLKRGGRVLLDLASGAYMRAHFEPRSWEWIDEAHFVCRERALSEDGRRLVSREVITHIDEGVLKDQFYAERLYDRDELTALLASAGFSHVDFHGTHVTGSERGQDLGMMARRSMVTARTDSVHSHGSAYSNGQAAPRRHVAVVMGDPRLPDETKLGGAFDADDFAVIDRLKEALSALNGYHFTYLNDHRTLPEDLRALRGEVDLVLNLCDEGFENDPRKELHVPALLELLDLPYTGGGPQCLAHCYDKSLVRGAAREVGVPVAEARLVGAGMPLPEAIDLPYPVIVKPNTGDSSVGITQKSVVHAPEDLVAALQSVRRLVGPGRALLVEEFLTGKDLTVSVLGNMGAFRILPITEDDYGDLPEGLPPLCGYEAKWLPDSPYWMEDKTMRADLAQETRTLIERASTQMFERLGCRGYARFDWRLGADGRPRLLEVNPNPGWCFDGHMAVHARLAGLSYADLLRKILDVASRRVGAPAAQQPVNA